MNFQSHHVQEEFTVGKPLQWCNQTLSVLGRGFIFWHKEPLQLETSRLQQKTKISMCYFHALMHTISFTDTTSKAVKSVGNLFVCPLHLECVFTCNGVDRLNIIKGVTTHRWFHCQLKQAVGALACKQLFRATSECEVLGGNQSRQITPNRLSNNCNKISLLDDTF